MSGPTMKMQRFKGHSKKASPSQRVDVGFLKIEIEIIQINEFICFFSRSTEPFMYIAVVVNP